MGFSSQAGACALGTEHRPVGFTTGCNKLPMVDVLARLYCANRVRDRPKIPGFIPSDTHNLVIYSIPFLLGRAIFLQATFDPVNLGNCSAQQLAGAQPTCGPSQASNCSATAGLDSKSRWPVWWTMRWLLRANTSRRKASSC